jgi:hypothetical protein
MEKVPMAAKCQQNAKCQQMISRNWWFLTNLKKNLYKGVVIMQEMNDIIGDHDGCATDDISKLQLTQRNMSNHLENIENLVKLEIESINAEEEEEEEDEEEEEVFTPAPLTLAAVSAQSNIPAPTAESNVAGNFQNCGPREPGPCISGKDGDGISIIELHKELDMIEKKKKNIIIFGLKESENGNTENQGQLDKENVTKLLDDINAKSKITTTYRVGYSSRPLVVCFQSAEERNIVLSKAKGLKNLPQWKNVFLAEDLTRNQYLLEKHRETMLKEEAAIRNSGLGPNQGYFWKVIGGRGDRRIVRVFTSFH